MRRGIGRLATAVAAVALGACSDGGGNPVEGGPHVVVEPAQLALYVGGQGWIVAQVVDAAGGAAGSAAITFRSQDSLVATVSGGGLVRAVAPGRTAIVASLGKAQAAVPVTVSADERAALAELDLLSTHLQLDRRNAAPVYAEYRALDGFGRSICGQVPLEIRGDPAVLQTIDRTRGPLACAVQLIPVSPGEATVRIRSGALTDSVRVSVVDGGYQAFFAEVPPPGAHRAGEIVRYRARVVGPGGQPVGGQRVVFTVSAGAAREESGVTDAAGSTTLEWALPTRLEGSGGAHAVTLNAALPNGSMAADRRDVRMVAGPAARIAFTYRQGGAASSTPRPIVDSLVTGFFTMAALPSWADVTVEAFDRFGNRNADLQVSATQKILSIGRVYTYAATMYPQCGESLGYYSCAVGTGSLFGGRYDFYATADALQAHVYLKLRVCGMGPCTEPAP